MICYAGFTSAQGNGVNGFVQVAPGSWCRRRGFNGFSGKNIQKPWKIWYIWANYNELTTSSLEIIVSKGNFPQMALIQVSELLLFTQMITIRLL